MIRISGKAKARTLMTAAATFAMTPAFAHTDGSHGLSLMAGFAHPFSGLDHLLAMLAVGVWAAQHKRSAIWLLPAIFPLMMATGALAGMSGLHLPGIEAGVAGSVAVLGLLIAFAVRMPSWSSAAVVSVFALVHGYAHGMEIPQDASPFLYGAGFVAATLVLHLTGLVAGAIAGQKMAGRIVRFGGVGIAAAGAYLLAGIA